MRFLSAIFLAACLALSIAACGGVADPSDNTVQDFTGTLEPEVGTGDVYEFDVAENGEISVNLVDLSPNPSSILTVYVGGVVNGQCVPFSNLISSIAIHQTVLNTSVNKGHYCLTLYVSVALPAIQNYTLRLSHP